ncbi:MAG: DUF1592 domain-containing protein [Bryobacteraceae bacterium]|nr:DUF1592 domain-containing protein [Bryobacteraceae bacterium]
MKWSITAAALGAMTIGAPIALPSEPRFDDAVQPFVTRHCVFCHNGKLQMAGLDFEPHLDAAKAEAVGDIWEKTLAKLRSGEMPPKGRPRPAAEELSRITEWLETTVAKLEKDRRPDPGRVVARRLNRSEYNNTVRDLLGVDLRPADEFPLDDSGYGFDNIADVLTISPAHMERYLAAAEKVSRAAIVVDLPVPVTQERYQLEPRPSITGEMVWPFEYQVKHNFPVEGEYEVTATLGGRRRGGLQPLKLTVALDGEKTAEFDVDMSQERLVYEQRLLISEGKHTLKAIVRADASNVDDSVGEHAGPNSRERTVVFDHFDIRGPFEQRPRKVTEAYRRIFVCGHDIGRHEAACARPVLSALARRAYRRPVTDAEVDGLTAFVESVTADGGLFEEGMQVAVQAVLASPKFLFRIERDPGPGSDGAIHRINDFELASRLSYFLWSSMPDDELLQLADAGRLREPRILEEQARRMLRDPKSEALIRNFGGQWLQLRNLDHAKPDPDRFPDFDDELREAMRRETELFFADVMRQDRSLLDFIDGQYSYLNERLAEHYGLPDIEGDEFRRVELDGAQRSGILTHASILTVSSYPTRTSPVLRGLWVLENFLGAPPPAPPANVPPLDESQVGTAGTVRQQFEQHRSDPACSVCHNRIDPLGFGLENYDPVGAWRTHEGKFPIDATGELPGGRSFETPAELKRLLRADSVAFAECLAEKLLTYALGRGLEKYDKPALHSISRSVAGNDYRFSTLILEIAKSMPFQMRRPESAVARGD